MIIDLTQPNFNYKSYLLENPWYKMTLEEKCEFVSLLPDGLFKEVAQAMIVRKVAAGESDDN